MQRPHDPAPELAVAVDPWTGWPLKPQARTRLARLKEAEQAFRASLHAIDGTAEGSHPGDRRMALAFTKLDEVVLWAQNAILNQEG